MNLKTHFLHGKNVICLYITGTLIILLYSVVSQIKITFNFENLHKSSALTGVGGAAFPSEPPKIYLFEANRSFLIYICYERVPIFSGAFVGA